MSNTLQLIEKWRPYIVSLSRQFKNTIASQEDLESEGVIGVLKALKEYNESRSNLDTFIYQCINCCIIQCALRNAFPFSIPPGTLLVNKKIKEKEQAISETSIHLESDNDNRLVYKNAADKEVEISDLIENYDEFGIVKKYLLEGYTCQEIADQLNISCSHTWKVIDSARKKIVKEFSEI